MVDVKKVVLLGGSGFVGTYVANRLSERGIRVTVLARHQERARALALLPGLEVVEADFRCEKRLARRIEGHDAVINLVGILHSRDVKLPYSRDFARAHVDLPRTLVAACRAAGVRRLLHMSALNADPQGPSEYLASKGEGERIVLGARDLDVTLFRPSVIFGQGDSFLNLFATFLKKTPLFPLGFAQARFQPVWAADVADALVNALGDEAAFGQTYELCGPRVYTLRELVEYTARLCRSRARILPLSEGWAYLQAGLMWLLPKPPLSPDNLRSMTLDNVCTACRTPPAWQPAALEAIAPAYIANSIAPKRRLDAFRFKAGR